MNEVIDNKEFNHLKIHTQYSICEGALRTVELAKYCKENKIKAAGLSDTNNLCGALEFSELLAKSKTQPIIGTQINLLYKNHIGKLPLFARDLVGYKNLIKLSSKSFLEIKNDEEPHCKIEDLVKYSQGLILFTGSSDGFFGKLFAKNLIEEISLIIKKIKTVYKDNLYIEIQRHNDIGEQIFEKFLLELAEEFELPLIATNEVFYLNKEMHEAHDAYLCIGEKTYVNVKDRRKYSDQHYLKTSNEMHELFKDLPEALKNNANFPLRISYRPTNSTPILPNIQTSKMKNVDELMLSESTIGLGDKLKEYVFPETETKNIDNVKKIYFARLNHEISIISKMKYSSYFLIVSDYIKWAKKMTYQ